MKKALSMILVLTMVLALALPARAEEITPETGETSQNVTANYEAPVAKDAGTKYYVTIAWENTATDLKYASEKATYTWSGTELKYEKKVDASAGWSGAATWKITVTNQSNADIEFVTTPTAVYDSLKYTAASTTKVTTAAVSNQDHTTPIKYTDTDTKGEAQTGTATVTYEAGGVGTKVPDGKDNTTGLTVGTITVKVQTVTTDNN